MPSIIDLDLSVRLNHRSYGILLGALQFTASRRWGLTCIVKCGRHWYVLSRWLDWRREPAMYWYTKHTRFPAGA